MNHNFFQQLEAILAPERLDAYRQDGVPPATTLARYLWNMALCESLYSPLQMAEIALRNSVHHVLSARYQTPAWYEVIPSLPPWQQNQLVDARKQLSDAGKKVTPGGMVAELHFGFWTGFFNKSHARTGIGSHLAKHALAERNPPSLQASWFAWLVQLGRDGCAPHRLGGKYTAGRQAPHGSAAAPQDHRYHGASLFGPLVRLSRPPLPRTDHAKSPRLCRVSGPKRTRKSA